jgi:hypothetical protein
MFVWGGGGIQLLCKDLHARGLFEALVAGECPAGEGLEESVREKLVGAEMLRRTFTNCCNIMRKHDFVSEWNRWKEAA